MSRLVKIGEGYFAVDDGGHRTAICKTLLPEGWICGRRARWYGYRNPYFPFTAAWFGWRARVQLLVENGYRSLRCWRHA